MSKRPTTKALLERIAALEAKVKELEARPQIVIQQAPAPWHQTTSPYPYLPHSPSLPYDGLRPWCVTSGIGTGVGTGAIGGNSDGTARWELRQAHISGN